MTTPTWVALLIMCDCQPSDYEAIVDLASEMSDYFFAEELDTTHFEWSIDSNHTSVYLYERYANSQQALAHMANFGTNYGSRFMSLLKPASVVVFGFPSADLCRQLEGLSPIYKQSFAGFQR